MPDGTMSRWWWLKFFIMVPFSAFVVVPTILLLVPLRGLFWAAQPWQAYAGFFLLVLGAYLCCSTISIFWHVGKGTPAPWRPPKKLITFGPYRYSRNPMMIGSLLILAAEALFFSSYLLAAWCLLFLAGANAMIAYYEEPATRKRFGKDYVAYTKRVRRWI